MDMSIISSILMLVAGIGVFIVACSILSSNIEAVSSNKLKAMFAKATKSKLTGVGIGTATTAAIQSSAATIVLVIGFVNAGAMGLTLAATIIYGANIGTTITAWIASLGTVGANSISLTVIFAACAGIGAFITMFSKKDSTKAKSGVLTGFGLIFVGLWMMSYSMSGLAGSDAIREFISGINNIFLLILIGFAITAMTQSSSVTTAILISMLPVGAATGLITLEQAIYLTLGANIGSCVIVLVTGFTGSLNAKRTSLIHLFFNVFGVTLFVIAGLIMGMFGITYSGIFSSVFEGLPGLQLSLFHTTFKVVTTIIMLPLTAKLIDLIIKITPEKNKKDENEPHFYYIDKLMLKNPPVAVQQLKSEIINMSRIAITNFKLSTKMIRTLDFEEKETFEKNENELDYLAWEISKFLVKLSNLNLMKKDRMYIGTVYHTITDLERVGDYAENIVEYAEKLKAMNGSFSETAVEEINRTENLISELYEQVLKAYTDSDLEALSKAFDVEEMIDDATAKMADNHINRLNEGKCTLEVGAEYLSLASDAERVADHILNMGKTVREIEKPAKVEQAFRTSNQCAP